MRTVGLLAALLGAGLVTVSAAAQEPVPSPHGPLKWAVAGGETVGEAPAPGVVGKLRAHGARVTALGERGGLSGWLVDPGEGDVYTLYVSERGYSVAGMLYGPDGLLVTRSQLEAAGRTVTAGTDRRDEARSSGRKKEASSGAREYRRFPVAAREAERRREARDREVAAVMSDPRVAAGEAVKSKGSGGERFTVVRRTDSFVGKPAPAGLFAKSAAAFGFTLGHRGRTALVFADPGCRWSREAVDALGKQAMAGRFRLRVIPVGVLGGESARAAVRIASSPDPALAWFGRGAAPEHRAGGMWIEESNAAFDRWGENAVPLIAWPGRSGGYVYSVGSIPDVDAWVEEAFGP